jgi:hypothetical protein
MRVAAAIAVIVLLAPVTAATAAGERPALRGVTAIRLANYNSPSVLYQSRDQVSPIVSELNTLRRRVWRGGDTRLACYSTLVVLAGKKTLGTFRILPEHMVEREGSRGVPVYSLELQPGDIPLISRLLQEIAPAKDCD